MPSGAVKAVVLVSDLDAVLGFFELAGVGPVERFASTGEQAAIGLGWPVDQGATRGAIVGARQGILELVEIPSALRDSVEPGVAALSFGVRDVEGLTAIATSAGLAVDGPHDIAGVDGAVSTLTRVEVGGMNFELIRFG